MLHTRIPRRVASGISTLFTPTPKFEITWSDGPAASITPASIRFDSVHRMPETPGTRRRISSRVIVSSGGGPPVRNFAASSSCGTPGSLRVTRIDCSLIGPHLLVEGNIIIYLPDLTGDKGKV